MTVAHSLHSPSDFLVNSRTRGKCVCSKPAGVVLVNFKLELEESMSQ